MNHRHIPFIFVASIAACTVGPHILSKSGSGRWARYRLVFWIGLLELNSACTSMQSLPTIDQRTLAQEIRIGEIVQITRKNGISIEASVTELANDGIRAGDEMIAYSDIETIKIEKFDSGKTTKWVLGIVASLAVAVLLIESGCTRVGPSCNAEF